MRDTATQTEVWTILTVIMAAATLVWLLAIPVKIEFDKLTNLRISEADRRQYELLIAKCYSDDSNEMKMCRLCQRVWSSLSGQHITQN